MAVSFTGARHQLNIALRPILLQVYSKRDACHQSFSSLDGVRQHMASPWKIEISGQPSANQRESEKARKRESEKKRKSEKNHLRDKGGATD